MNKVVCPHCGEEVELSEAFKRQFEYQLERQIRGKLEKEINEKSSLELEDAKKALFEKDKKIDEMRKMELQMREEKRKMEEKEKELELVLQRKLDEQRARVTEEIAKKAYEEHRLKDLEKEKKIKDMESLIEELKRKSQQGSQQTQGEVLELDLEESLRATFPDDEIEAIGKGVRGADIRQVVKSPKGTVCGVILWESKRTKAWSGEWVPKLKEDLRAEKADVPVIVTTTMPKESVTQMMYLDGVWVVTYSLALTLCQLLRKNILDVARQRVANSHKTDKASLLYDYIISHEFRQQVEAIAEIFKEEEELIQRERASYERLWKAREAKNKRLLLSAANIYGSVQGYVGASMPQIKALDILELGEGEK